MKKVAVDSVKGRNRHSGGVPENLKKGGQLDSVRGKLIQQELNLRAKQRGARCDT